MVLVGLFGSLAKRGPGVVAFQYTYFRREYPVACPSGHLGTQ